MINTFFYLLLIFLCYCSRVESDCKCGVTFYQHEGYGGNQLKVYAGQQYLDLSKNGWNDQISSLRFFNNTDTCRCLASVCWNANCKDADYGGSTEYIDDHPEVGPYANDKFSALMVKSFDPSTDAYAMFYKSCAGSYVDYSWFAQVTDDNQFEGVRDIFKADFQRNDIGDDQLSRVVVSEHAAVQLYWDDNYGGSNLLITGPADIGCLTSTAKGNWNDRVSSAKLYDLRKGGFPAPSGYWVLHTSAGSDQALSYTVHRGYTTEETTTNTENFNLQISNSIESGVNFGVGSASASLSISTSYSISEMLQNSIVLQSDYTCVETCQKNTCPAGSITYLYSWQMDFQRPWDDAPGTTLVSCNYICRCEPTPPRCPLTACNNTVCSTCLPY